MRINILDTYKLYTKMLSQPDLERHAFFDEKIMQPFSTMFERMNIPRDPNTFGCLALSGTDNTTKEMLTQLLDSDAWNKAHQAIEYAESNLQNSSIQIPDELLLGIFLADPMIFGRKSRIFWSRFLSWLYPNYDCAEYV